MPPLPDPRTNRGRPRAQDRNGRCLFRPEWSYLRSHANALPPRTYIPRGAPAAFMSCPYFGTKPGRRASKMLNDRQAGWTSPLSELKLQEDLSLIEPVAQIPHDQQYGAGLGHRREVTEPFEMQREHADSAIQPAAQNIPQRIDEDRIRSHHDQREGPLAVALHLNEPIEGQEHQKDPAGAVEGEGRGADALDNGVPGMNEPSQRKTSDCPDGDEPHLLAVGSPALQQLAGPDSEEGGHRAGDEINGGPIIIVRMPKYIGVDDRADVGRLRQEWSLRSRECHEQRPITGEQHNGDDDLRAKAELHDQVAEKIGDPDLRQHVDELKMQDAGGDRHQDLAHQDQPETADD